MRDSERIRANRRVTTCRTRGFRWPTSSRSFASKISTSCKGSGGRRRETPLRRRLHPYGGAVFVDRQLSVLDLCCGPGDIGRFMHHRFAKARVDRVDRDQFFLSLCKALNRRAGVAGESFTRDLWDSRWTDDLPREYHAIAVTASLHWLDVQRLGEIFRGVLKLLRAGGVFLFAEPACTNAKFAAALANWKPCIPHTYDPAPGIDSGNGRTHCSVTTKALFWARVPSVRSRSAIAAFPFSSTLRCCPMPASDRSMCYAGRASTS